jgi:hypothetical protein
MNLYFAYRRNPNALGQFGGRMGFDLEDRTCTAHALSDNADEQEELVVKKSRRRRPFGVLNVLPRPL